MYTESERKIDAALDIAFKYANTDGNNHKSWVIDQIVRKLLGDKYEEVIAEYEYDGYDQWDKGIAP